MASVKDAWDDQMSQFSKKYNLSLDEISIQRRNIIQAVNASTGRVKEVAKKDMKVICDNYANKVGRGERKS